MTGTAFNLGMSLTDAELAGCGFNQSVLMGMKMLASGRTLKGSLRLNIATGSLSLQLKFDQGTIGVQGNASLTGVGPSIVRGDVEGATLDLDLDQGSFSCNNLMDFSFTLTDVP